MNCDQALELIAAHMDRELPFDEQAPLEAHLNGCASCRAVAEAWRQQDAELRQAFAPRRAAATVLAERVIAEIRTLPLPSRARARRLWPMMIVPLLSAAAGFLLAVLVLWPHLDQPPVEVVRFVEKEGPERIKIVELERPPAKDFKADPPMVQLAAATGAVKQRSSEGKKGEDWSSLPTDGKIPFGCTVRTDPKARCEFRCPDGSEIRLNGGTEVVFTEDRQCQLKQGQMWSNIAKAKTPFLIQVLDTTIVAGESQFDLQCRSLMTKDRGETQEAILTVLKGKTEVAANTKKMATVVETGQEACIADGQAREPQAKQTHEILAATKWVMELLVLKGKDDPELTERVLDILDQIADAKLSHFDDVEIRRLGERAVLPLAAYLKTNPAQKDPKKRIRAAQLLADLSTPAVLGDLIALLRDKEPKVRYYAAQALLRLTGLTDEPSPAACQDAKNLDSVCKPWEQWWERNKHRYLPTAP